MPIIVVENPNVEDVKIYGNPKTIADKLPDAESSIGQYYIIKEDESSNYIINYSKK